MPWAELREEGYDVLPFWYGSNIHPVEEEQRRREALGVLSAHMNGRALYDEYAPLAWLERASSLSGEPEGGARCALCFRLQLEAAARKTVDEGILLFCTTLTISPHKNAELINVIGAECAARHGVEWLTRVFRKKNGFVRSVVLSKEYGLYRQSYCGCRYSMRKGDDEHGTVSRGKASSIAT